MTQSQRFSLNAVDWKSMGRGLLDVVVSAILTFITDQFIPALKLEPTTLSLVMGGWLLISKFIRKFISGPAK